MALSLQTLNIYKKNYMEKNLSKWAFVAEWLARRFNPSAEGRRAGSIPDAALGVVHLSRVVKISCGYPVYGDVFLALCNTLWCIGFM